MSDLAANTEYLSLLQGIKERIASARVLAARHVNRELILLYWWIGHDIVEKQKIEGWGKSIVERLSNDIQRESPGVTGYSPQNLWFMRQSYTEYTDSDFLSQVVREMEGVPKHLLRKQIALLERVAETKAFMDDHIDNEPFVNLLQAVREFDGNQRVSLMRTLLTLIPWGQNILIFTQIKDARERLYYILATANYGWSRAVLLNQIKANAYERAMIEEKANNFELALPADLSEQANESLKSSYNLEFLGIDREVKEREIERKLLEKLKDSLLELGYGFCFVGSQYRLAFNKKEYFIDLLFYHRFLKCLVAFELKVTEFKPEYAGKMDFYLNLLNDLERAEGDNPSIGVILCAKKDDLDVEYALKSKTNPIGVAEYQLRKRLPPDLKGQLPTKKQLMKNLRIGEK